MQLLQNAAAKIFNTQQAKQPPHRNPLFSGYPGVSELILRFYCVFKKPSVLRLLPISAICRLPTRPSAARDPHLDSLPLLPCDPQSVDFTA